MDYNQYEEKYYEDIEGYYWLMANKFIAHPVRSCFPLPL